MTFMYESILASHLNDPFSGLHSPHSMTLKGPLHRKSRPREG